MAKRRSKVQGGLEGAKSPLFNRETACNFRSACHLTSQERSGPEQRRADVTTPQRRQCVWRSTAPRDPFPSRSFGTDCVFVCLLWFSYFSLHGEKNMVLYSGKYPRLCFVGLGLQTIDLSCYNSYDMIHQHERVAINIILYAFNLEYIPTSATKNNSSCT